MTRVNRPTFVLLQLCLICIYACSCVCLYVCVCIGADAPRKFKSRVCMCIRLCMYTRRRPKKFQITQHETLQIPQKVIWKPQEAIQHPRGAPKMPPGTAQETPRRTRGPQEVPQDTNFRPPNASRASQEAKMNPQDTPRQPQDPPQEPPEGALRGPQEASTDPLSRHSSVERKCENHEKSTFSRIIAFTRVRMTSVKSATSRGGQKTAM